MGGVCIGDDVYRIFPRNWGDQLYPLPITDGIVYTATQSPYIAWELNYRLTPPAF